MDSKHPLLKPEPLAQELNIPKLIGQISAAILTALVSRWAIGKIDEWMKTRNRRSS